VNLFAELIGWLGTFLILLAYFLLTSKKLSRDSKTYHSMNLFGGIGITINSIANGAYPPAVLNIIWSLIAIYGIVKGLGLFKRKRFE
jgi:formate hydrogenlyase subunit 3/multisubunit Na+/H+ antiporter MnhD subunit